MPRTSHASTSPRVHCRVSAETRRSGGLLVDRRHESIHPRARRALSPSPPFTSSADTRPTPHVCGGGGRCAAARGSPDGRRDIGPPPASRPPPAAGGSDRGRLPGQRARALPRLATVGARRCGRQPRRRGHGRDPAAAPEARRDGEAALRLQGVVLRGGAVQAARRRRLERGREPTHPLGRVLVPSRRSPAQPRPEQGRAEGGSGRHLADGAAATRVRHPPATAAPRASRDETPRATRHDTPHSFEFWGRSASLSLIRPAALGAARARCRRRCSARRPARAATAGGLLSRRGGTL